MGQIFKSTPGAYYEWHQMSKIGNTYVLCIEVGVSAGQRWRPVIAVSQQPDAGWEQVDVILVTGDAYVDHPSFAMAILHRVLERAGFRVAMLSQPDWKSCEPWRQFGRPRLFFAISAGNMDSLINHYTASKKVRNDDAYSPGGRIGLRRPAGHVPPSADVPVLVRRNRGGVPRRRGLSQGHRHEAVTAVGE